MSGNFQVNAVASNLKILVLSRYDRQGASSRLRTMQYLPFLEKIGFSVEFQSLFDSKYLEDMYGSRRSTLAVAHHLRRRVGHLKFATADLIWLEKEALPWIPWFVERILWPKNIPIVTDYDDAIFHRYDQSGSPLIRRLLGKKIDFIMGSSSCVFSGNGYISERARGAGARRIELVPTVVDIDKYQRSIVNRIDERLRIGWIGTPETWTSFVTSFCNQIKSIALNQRAVFRVVGAESRFRVDGPKEFFPWSEDAEVSLIQGMDVGLMPLPDTPWTRGKCGYKLIQYLACGVPVVASPVGVNTEIVEHGVNGFLASTDQEWADALNILLADPELRARMGEAGRRKIMKHYSLQVWGPRVAQMLRDLASNGGGN